MQVKNRNRRLIDRGPTNRRRQVVCRDHIVVITQRPKELLRYSFVVINNQYSRFHGRYSVNQKLCEGGWGSRTLFTIAMTIPKLHRPREWDDQNKIRPTAMVPSSEHLTQMDRGMSTTEDDQWQ